MRTFVWVIGLATIMSVVQAACADDSSSTKSAATKVKRDINSFQIDPETHNGVRSYSYSDANGGRIRAMLERGRPDYLLAAHMLIVELVSAHQKHEEASDCFAKCDFQKCVELAEAADTKYSEARSSAIKQQSASEVLLFIKMQKDKNNILLDGGRDFLKQKHVQLNSSTQK